MASAALVSFAVAAHAQQAPNVTFFVTSTSLNDARVDLRLPGVMRLVGIASASPDEVAVLSVVNGQSRIEIFELGSGRRRIVRHDPQDGRDQLMLAYAEGDEREYAGVRVYTDEQSTSIRQWTDVFIQSGGGPAADLTNGNGLSSRQPALSHDRALVAYVNVGRGR